jgi:hypothetical protein
MKFHQNPSGDSFSVETALRWVGLGFLRLHYVRLGKVRFDAQTLVRNIIRSPQCFEHRLRMLTREKLIYTNFYIFPVAQRPYKRS